MLQSRTGLGASVTCPSGMIPDMGACVAPTQLTLWQELSPDLSGIGGFAALISLGVLGLLYLVLKN